MELPDQSDALKMAMESAFDENKNLRLGFRLNQEHHELLQALLGSPGWKVYRQILIEAKNAYFNSILAIKDPNDVMKTVGLASGINFAINQLAVLDAEYKRAQLAKQKEAELKEKRDKKRR